MGALAPPLADRLFQRRGGVWGWWARFRRAMASIGAKAEAGAWTASFAQARAFLEPSLKPLRRIRHRGSGAFDWRLQDRPSA